MPKFRWSSSSSALVPKEEDATVCGDTINLLSHGAHLLLAFCVVFFCYFCGSIAIDSPLAQAAQLMIDRTAPKKQLIDNGPSPKLPSPSLKVVRCARFGFLPMEGFAVIFFGLLSLLSLSAPFPDSYALHHTTQLASSVYADFATIFNQRDSIGMDCIVLVQESDTAAATTANATATHQQSRQREIYLHRPVLAQRARYFRDLLSSESNQPVRIDLTRLGPW